MREFLPAPVIQIAWSVWTGKRTDLRVAVSKAFACILLAAIGISCSVLSTETGQDSKTAEFVGNDACRDCHLNEFEQWTGSHHQLAMQVATEESVLGDFSGAEFQYFDLTSRFYRKDNKFMVRTEGADGQLEDFEVSYVFGVEPLQQYLVKFPGGRLQCLTIAWDTQEKRWFHLYPNERIHPGDPLHWTNLYQNWNAMCAECHTTNLRKGYDLESDSFDTVWSEINVSCQACHGPGSSHVEWAENQEKSMLSSEDGLPYGLLVDFSSTDSRYQVERCAPCHSRRARIADEYLHYRPFLDEFRPEVLAEGLYYTDGQILDEVYVYGSFVQSKMYLQGVRCSDCHEPHSLELRMPGNELCTQCHQESGSARFSGLQSKLYDSPEHHFHPVDSEGGLCVSCHMPERAYMVVDPRRDHSFRVPRPDLSVRLGVPNACNNCHSEESAEWAAEKVAGWHPDPDRSIHFGEIIQMGRSGNPDSIEALSELARETAASHIVRATALTLLRQFPEASVSVSAEYLDDPEPLVRATAIGSQRAADIPLRFERVVKFLEDGVRTVRMEAVSVLASVPKEYFDEQQARTLELALAEYQEAQKSTYEFPWAHLNLGVLYSSLGETERALESYRRSIGKDYTFLPARVNLANLLNQLGRNSDAEEVIREAIRVAPREGELHYSLGLLLAEENRLSEAAKSLAEAVRLLPGRARVRYNYGLALQYLGRGLEAERALLDAYESAPEDPDIVYALATHYVKQGDLQRALRFTEKLINLAPEAPGPRRMAEQIRSELNRQ